MNYKNIFFIFLLLIVNIINIKTCTTNLECKMTGCCHNGVCEKESKCKKRNILCYALVGVGAFVVNVLIVIYSLRKIRETKKYLNYLKKTEFGSLTRKEQYRLSLKSKSNKPTTQNE